MNTWIWHRLHPRFLPSLEQSLKPNPVPRPGYPQMRTHDPTDKRSLKAHDPEYLRTATKLVHRVPATIMALNFLKAIFGGGKPNRPSRVPTDEVLPLHEFDGRMQVRSIIMGWTMRFDDILDAEKLNVSLSRLLEIGAWKKLGGRLRERVSGATSGPNLAKQEEYGEGQDCRKEDQLIC